jgi:hypothetical protein
MALVTRSALASIDVGLAQFVPQITGLLAGEDLDIAAPCYIKTADGKVWMTDATAANEAAEVVGFAARHTHSGEPVTLFQVARFRYGTGLTIGNILYAAATAGRLDTAATTGDAIGCARVITATDIECWAHDPVLTSGVIADASITLAKLDALARGSIISGQAVNRPTALDAKGNGKILVGDGTDVNSVSVSGDATLANTGAVTLASNKLTGTHVKETAAAEVLGAIPILYRYTIAAGAVGNTDITITNKTRVIDCWLVLVGAGILNCTAQLFNGAGAITEAMAAGGSAHAMVRAAVIDHANAEVADSGTLRVTTATGATQPDMEVYVLGLRLA